MAEVAKVRIGNATYYDARQLSDLTYGSVPDDSNGVGARWLVAVAEQYADERDELRDYGQDRISEIADSISNLSDRDTWQVVTDLQLFRAAESGLLDYGLWADNFKHVNPRTYREETAWALRFDKISDALRMWLYETASTLVYALRQADTEES